MNQDKTPKNAQQASKPVKGFSDEEKAAMKARAREQKAEADKVQGENAALAAIAEMQEPDRAMATRLHEIIKASAPGLSPTTWYGMPAYVRDGKVICHFQTAKKFKMRYATIGFSDQANLDDGALWPVAFAVKELTPTVEARIVELLKKAVS